MCSLVFFYLLDITLCVKGNADKVVFVHIIVVVVVDDVASG